ncbi:MAG: PAS domain S-box protein [Bacteroidetes bacterium]|nr:PAS domain S-box protein [Bacteroidota bacterium]
MKSVKLFIVEDELLPANDLKVNLEELNYKVLGVESSGEKFLERLAVMHRSRNDIDIAIVDIRLAGKMSGIEAAKIASEKYQCGIIFLTRLNKKKVFETSFPLLKPYTYLFKPVDIEQVHAAIEVAFYQRHIEMENKRIIEDLQNEIRYRKQVETELLKSEEEFRLVAQNVSDIIAVGNTDGKFLFMSPSSQRILDIEPDECINISMFELFHPDEFEMMETNWKKMLKEGHGYFPDHRIRKSDGSFIWMETRGTVYTLPHQHEKRVVIVSHEITSRRQAEYEKSKRYIEQLIAEQKINFLLKEKHQKDLDEKNRELTTSAIYISQKNKILAMVKKEISHYLEDDKYLTQRDFLKILKTIDENVQFDNDWNSVKVHFEKIHPTFFATLRKKFKNLTPSDHKLCALLKMNLKTKEISQILKITPESTEIARIRLRKKLKLPKEVNLTQFIAGI